MSDTGTTVISMPREGQFDACLSRTGTCGYACCGFGTLGNFIAPLPGELEMAKEQGLSFDHLRLEAMDDGTTRVHCERPCVGGEFKSIDCAIYPAFIANETGTRFLVADNRKCPIPHNELISTLRAAQQVAVDWERKNPGTLASMATAGKEFRAYQPFGSDISFEGVIRQLTPYEVRAITPTNLLPDNYIAKFKGVALEGYSGRGTPEDIPMDYRTLPPLIGTSLHAFREARERGDLIAFSSIKAMEKQLHSLSTVFVNPTVMRKLNNNYGDVTSEQTRSIEVALGWVATIAGVQIGVSTNFDREAFAGDDVIYGVIK